LLIEAKTMVEKAITNVCFKHVKYGCTLCSNGWIDVLECSLMNVMFVSPFGDVFEKSINSNHTTKMVHFLANAIVMVTETMGLRNVMQVCIDNIAWSSSITNCLCNNVLICMHKDVWFMPWISS
jgi:hypothetical protein